MTTSTQRGMSCMQHQQVFFFTSRAPEKGKKAKEDMFSRNEPCLKAKRKRSNTGYSLHADKMLTKKLILTYVIIK